MTDLEISLTKPAIESALYREFNCSMNMWLRSLKRAGNKMAGKSTKTNN